MSSKSKEPFRHNYGFRFRETPEYEIAQIHGIGWENTISTEYDWDGLNRGDQSSFLFQYTLSGRGMIQIDQQTHPLLAGKAFMVWIPGNHRYYFPADSDHWEYMFVILRGERLATIIQELIGKLGYLPDFTIDSPTIRTLKLIFEQAKLRQITDGYLNSLYAYQFIIELQRSTTFEKSSSEIPESILKTVHFIDLNYEQLVNLDEMAEISGLSKYHFLRQFNRFMGLTPLEYLNKLRIEKAAVLLKTSEQTLDEIAIHVGFANGNYFSKVFRHWVGMSPGKYRSEQGLATDNLFLR
ncbi:AraC family transcriptional regulator [Paenibacillus agricola]|uniref:AraC family transcriptional regulator n=1 Tax=Paenibacillus agricola TaxID=2716264 RepID=A0ABX0J0B6_9BACL|nr:AraC family transcriptional regulator [Paenibacillus agricola]NHN28900.1 AraC family transcriptional regulator [Paenibacillus agricola]